MRQNRAEGIQEDEKLIAFRMSARRYAVLKEVAARHEKPIAQLINEILDQKLKLDHRAQHSQHQPASKKRVVL